MKLLEKLKQETANIRLKMAAAVQTAPDSVTNTVPFVSQFANPEWAEKILKDGQPKTSDPDWMQSGADSVEEYATWVTTTCGMACTAMALAYFKDQEHKTTTLAKDALQHGVYKARAGELSSMHYQEYVAWVSTFGLSAAVYSRLTVSGIKHILTRGGLVIASVNPNIRGYETAPQTQTGGHLVLVTGYNTKDNSITLQNPSGFVSMQTHHNHTVPIAQFKKCFAGRGLALYSK